MAFAGLDGGLTESQPTHPSHVLQQDFDRIEKALSIFETTISTNRNRSTHPTLAAFYGFALHDLARGLKDVMTEHLATLTREAKQSVVRDDADAVDLLELGIRTQGILDQLGGSEKGVGAIPPRQDITEAILSGHLDMALELLQADQKRLHFPHHPFDPKYCETGQYEREGSAVRRLVLECATVMQMSLVTKSSVFQDKLLPPSIFFKLSETFSDLMNYLAECGRGSRESSDAAVMKGGLEAIQAIYELAAPIEEWRKSSSMCAPVVSIDAQKTAELDSLDRVLRERVMGREYVCATIKPRPQAQIPTTAVEGLGASKYAVIEIKNGEFNCVFGVEVPRTEKDSVTGVPHELRRTSWSLAENDPTHRYVEAEGRRVPDVVGDSLRAALVSCDGYRGKSTVIFPDARRDVGFSWPFKLGDVHKYAASPEGDRFLIMGRSSCAVMDVSRPEYPVWGGDGYTAVPQNGSICHGAFLGERDIVLLTNVPREGQKDHIECLSLWGGRNPRKWLEAVPFNPRLEDSRLMASADSGLVAFQERPGCPGVWLASAKAEDDGLGQFENLTFPLEGISQVEFTPNLRMAIAKAKDRIMVFDLLALKNRETVNVIAEILTAGEDNEAIIISDDGASLVVTPKQGTASPTQVFNLKQLEDSYKLEKRKLQGTS